MFVKQVSSSYHLQYSSYKQMFLQFGEQANNNKDSDSLKLYEKSLHE